MKTIGITGGIGAGKSRILSYIQQNCNCRILLSDEAAHEIQEPGMECYDRLTALLGKEILEKDGRIDRKKMAAAIFSDAELLKKVNAIIHPAVKTYILDEMEKERQAGEKDVFFLEAALLIEEGYDKLLDELWYIYADEDTRRKRLMEDRGYPPEKVERIFKSQLSEEEFLAHCKVVIDNSRNLGDTYRQIDERLKEAGLIK